MGSYKRTDNLCSKVAFYFSLFYKYFDKMGVFPAYEEMYGAFLGLATGLTTNMMAKRPAFSRFAFLGVVTAVGYGGGMIVKNRARDRVIAQKIFLNLKRRRRSTKTSFYHGIQFDFNLSRH